MWLLGLSSIIIAMGVTWAVTPLVIRLGAGLGALDLPGGRKLHSAPVPRIGGLAVFIGFAVGLAWAAYLTGSLLTVPQPGVYWRGLAFAAVGLLLVGLLDDLRGLSFHWKFAAQVAAAIYVWNCGFRIEAISHPFGGDLDLGWMALPLTVLWIVGITNAVNLIDGLDGLAVGIALITTGAVAAIGILRGELGITAASVALAGSLAGFLRYNFNPARIFLGDSGSMFLGFVLAVTSVRGSQKGPTAVAVLVPILVLGLPLLDTGSAVIRRLYRLGRLGHRTEGNALRYMWRNAEHVFLPDRGHIHHRLLDLGLTQRSAVLTLYCVGTVFALAAFALVMLRSVWVAALLIGVLVLLMAGFVIQLSFRSTRMEPSAQQVPGSETAESVPASLADSASQRLQAR